VSYSEELTQKCAAIEAELDATLKPKKKKEAVIYYNIQKRSLPVGLDQTVVFRITKEEVPQWKQRLKPKLISYEDHGMRTVHYYDVVRADGYKAGIYDNGGVDA
jgi:hypothetical protein